MTPYLLFISRRDIYVSVYNQTKHIAMKCNVISIVEPKQTHRLNLRHKPIKVNTFRV